MSLGITALNQKARRGEGAVPPGGLPGEFDCLRKDGGRTRRIYNDIRPVGKDIRGNRPPCRRSGRTPQSPADCAIFTRSSDKSAATMRAPLTA